MPTLTHPRGPSLLECFDPRSNGLTVIRLVLAATVAIVHSLQLAIGWQPVLGPATEVGSLAVDAFFVISGFLVTASMVRLGSVRRYAWHRFLRIMPGFWVCLLVTAAVVAPALAVLSGTSVGGVFAGSDSAVSYVASNVFLLMRQFGIGGFGPEVPGDGVVNGALWTLAYEAACYAAVAVLGLVGALLRRPWVLLVLTAVLQLATIAQSVGLVAVPQDRLLRLALLFLLGACGQRFAKHVTLSPPWLIAAAVSVALGVALLTDYRAIGAAGFAYLVLALAARSPLTWDPGFDLSYGVYVYHWPIALLVITASRDRLPGFAIVVVVLVAAGLVAALSWYTIEAPALRFKSAGWVTAQASALNPSRRVQARSGRQPRS